MTVLLIDDNPIDLMIHEKLIKRALKDAEVAKAESGQAAIQHLDNCGQHPDLVLLDIKMPIMNGFEFLENIQAKGYAEKLRIYMVSSSIDPTDIQTARKNTMVEKFLEKPLTVETLKTLL